MKKIMVLLLATTMLFASIGCSNGAGGSGNENGGSGGSVVTKDDYLGIWTGTMNVMNAMNEMDVIELSITLNADGSCVAYNSKQGFAVKDSNWTFSNPGVTVIIGGEDTVPGRLDNGKLVVKYGQDISLTKVDTSAYVGTWTGTMDGQELSIDLYANGTISAYMEGAGDTTGFWTVTNSGFIMWLDMDGNFPELGVSGKLQNGNLVVNYMGQNISLTKE